MAMKLKCCCLLAAALLGCLVDAQYTGTSQQPAKYPQTQVHNTQSRYTPQKPKPQEPLNPQRPQQPLNPQRPQQPQEPLRPQKPQEPQRPLSATPQRPLSSTPQRPLSSTPQRPLSSTPQHAQQPQYPNKPKVPQDPQKPSEVFHSCDVNENYKIQCGPPAISSTECEAINCCFDGRSCYYGTQVTLQCTKDAQFIVVVARDATLPNMDLDSLTFLGDEQSCSPVGTTSAFAIYQFPVTACGTQMKEEAGVLIYENKMSCSYEVAIGPLGAITRDSQFELFLQCRYIGTTVEALIIDVGQIPAPLPVAAPGPLRVELRLGNGQCFGKGCNEADVAYNSFYTDGEYPVTKVLRDPVYVEVRILERTDPNLVLTLGRCWATSNPYPHSLPQWNLLVDGCPYRDDRYLSTLVPVDASSGLMYPSHHRRFIFKMFTFVAVSGHKKGSAGPEDMTPLNEKVFIHCDTTVCIPSAGDNCEPRCYRQKRDIAGAVKTGIREEPTVVSSHEIVFTASSTE